MEPWGLKLPLYGSCTEYFAAGASEVARTHVLALRSAKESPTGTLPAGSVRVAE